MMWQHAADKDQDQDQEQWQQQTTMMTMVMMKTRTRRIPVKNDGECPWHCKDEDKKTTMTTKETRQDDKDNMNTGDGENGNRTTENQP
jgi:hypothetical protein